MSGNTSIEWTDRTWNPLTGCTKVSPGCDHCYAKTMHERFNGPGSFDTVTLHPDRLDQPLSWRKPARVFVNSMSDLFHQDVPDEYIADVWATMARTPQHTYQILTKRHARMRSLLNSREFTNAFLQRLGYEGILWPLSNVWLGVSVENQRWADFRIPELLSTPAMVRFISAEPLLGPVDLSPWLSPPGFFDNGSYQYGPGQPVYGAAENDYEISYYPIRLDWVIVGGESGPGARPMHPNWAQQIRDQCEEARVPFLFKQWGSHDAAGKRASKHAAGRELDGQTWDEYPDSAPVAAVPLLPGGQQ
jgi:protein gp37